MPLGQFTPGQTLGEALVVFDTFTTFNRGMKAGRSAFGAPTVAFGAGAGTATTGTLIGTDFAGNFNITAGGGAAAGTLATVVFGTPLGSIPYGVVATATDTNGSTALAAGAENITTTGFSVVTGAPTAAHVYSINYLVIQ